MHVQEYLKQHSLLDLANEHRINIFSHNLLPLIGLTFDQKNRVCNEPILKECRSLILERDTWKFVSRSFPSFFEVGENIEDTEKFSWHAYTCYLKLPGSLVHLYHFHGWRIATLDCFGLEKIEGTDKSWMDYFWDISDLDARSLNKDFSYTFQMAIPELHGVTRPSIHLLTIFWGVDELTNCYAKDQARLLAVPFPENHFFQRRENAYIFFETKSKEMGADFNGLVLRDSFDSRLKLDVKETIHPNMERLLDIAFDDVAKIWKSSRHIRDEKEFIKTVSQITSFHGILVKMRKKYGLNQTFEDLCREWAASEKAVRRKLANTARTLGD